MSTVTKEIVKTDLSFAYPLPFSQATVAGNTVYLSGCLGTTLEGNIISGGIAAETKQALKNLGAVLKAAGSSYENVLKTTVFLNDIKDAAAVNAEYKKVFSSNYPARSMFQVGRLPVGGNVEIECIALINKSKL